MIRSQKHQKSKNIESIYALSPMQEGLLFHTLYAPNSGVYIEQILLTFSGQMNAEIFKQSWQQLLQRHGALRTLFLWEGRQQPLQVVKKQVDLPWSYLDWKNISPMEQQQKLEAFLKRDRNQGFQLNKAPLMRCTLIRLANQTYKFIWTFHHILMDGWCFPIILKEVTSYYQSSNQGQRCNLLPVPPYKDYIIWLQQQDLEGAEGFWRKTLQGFTTPTPLVVEKRQQQELQHLPSYQHQQLTLGETTANALQSFARQYRLTPNVLVQAAWALLLSRYSDNSDVLFGITVSGRPASLSGVEEMVGIFLNTLPLRVQVTPKTQLIPWLEQLNQKQLELQEYSYSSLTKIKLLSEIPGILPLFESILVFENYPFEESLLQIIPDLQIVGLDSFSQTNYPLTLFVGVTTEDFILKISYDTSRFAADTIARMLRHLQTLLEAMVANPNIELGRLPLLTNEEQQQLLVEWNNTKTDYPGDKCIHQLFEEQVEKNPDAVAVVFEEQKLTYSQLNSKANQLAHYLQKLGVVPETLVGICVERSAEMVVGLLAILKAGGAYVPLDPNYPQERISYILADSQASVLLTTEKLVNKLVEEHQAQGNPLLNKQQVIYLDADWGEISQENYTDIMESGVRPDNQAYVIYTSGSTGKPKGVQINHRSLTNLLKSMSQIPGITDSDALLAVTTICFDIAALELYLPLIVGAVVVIVTREVASDGRQLLSALENSGATVMQATPATWQMLLSTGWQGNYQKSSSTPQKKFKVLCGGEALPEKLANQLLQTQAEVWNMYGPTETTIWSSANKLESSTNSDKNGSYKQVNGKKQPIKSIGKPIYNTQMYILDSNLQPVPVGVTGELYIGGEGLARGYLNQPKLTKEKFIPNPFREQANARVYKTGDLARYLPDGQIEYLGRIDNQVKIRGYRIETQEIETVLDQNATVKKTVVVAREDNPGDKRLVAYIVPETEIAASSNPELSNTQISSWQDIFNQQVDTRDTEIADSLFNTSIWRSSYDKEPIPELQMRVWAENIVSQVLAHKPQKVWEVGCGTGMLLFQIAPYTEKYLGTDISNVSLEYIKQQIEQEPDKYSHVSLAQKRAEEMADVAPNSFDAVLLSSIVQYFPSVEYLLQVIENSIRVVKPGGMIFLGDIRSLPLMRAFHSSVQLYQATPSLSRQQLKAKIDRQMEQEKELLLSPELFLALQEKYPEITHVQIRLQRGTEHNEMTKYRYSVLLHIEAQPGTVITPTVESGEALSVQEIETYLREQEPESICFSGLVNSRVANDVELVELLSQPESKQNVQQLRQKLESKEIKSIDPERLYKLSASCGYSLELCWSGQGSPELMDGVFVRSELASEGIVLTPLTQKSVVAGNWENYGNNPLSSQLRKELIPQLREYLESRLPEYMVPSGLMVLSQLPLTPNGKVDRKALPVPDMASSVLTEYVAPQTETQKILAEIWQEVLGIEQIGIHDNFFDLGGHSLMATKVVSRVRQGFGNELTLQGLFESPTIAGIAKNIEVVRQLPQDKTTLISETEEYERFVL
ncbi:MAG: amino acid adenylation domain-containing protein [Okeania sp. SIO2C9]|uniref:non-ribosomal peptide synthetase n=1 Tax=Okeania sp. SIO2C9 TaxID=2607791 RepID=UPI0013C04DEC|nr:non-ribosomal peptide synthetase [Okeania sp. SIO2C9]NEQ78399.1 amino acid adenylation domain-containing protein [Okeania sp. SIO2C9]